MFWSMDKRTLLLYIFWKKNPFYFMFSPPVENTGGCPIKKLIGAGWTFIKNSLEIYQLFLTELTNTTSLKNNLFIFPSNMQPWTTEVTVATCPLLQRADLHLKCHQWDSSIFLCQKGHQTHTYPQHVFLSYGDCLSV